MRRSQQSVNYAIGSIFGNTINIYLHGTVILSLITFIIGLLTSGTLDKAMLFMLDFYIAKLLPWPLDEAYLAETVGDFVISHTITVIVGTASATYRYHQAI